LDVAEESGLKLKWSGRSYFTLCPIHGEKTPSCSIVPNSDSTKDYFHCFSCGAGGDQINLFATLNNMSNRQAINLLAKRFGLAKDQPLPELLVREYAKNKRDRTLEKNFLKAYKQLFYDLCSIRDIMNNLETEYECYESITLIEENDFLVKYYHQEKYFEYLLEWLLAGLLEEISFKRQIEVFIIARGVVTEWVKHL
jgi:hypothetical protein